MDFMSTACSHFLQTWLLTTDSSALRPTESLALLNYNRSAFCPHLLTFISNISFSTSSSHLNLSLPLVLLPPQFTVKFLNCPSLIHSYQVSNPLQPLLKISATTSRSVYSSLNSWLVLILHINCSTTSPYTLLNIFPLPCISLFISTSVTAYDLKWLTYAILYAERLSYSCFKLTYPHYLEAL